MHSVHLGMVSAVYCFEKKTLMKASVMFSTAVFAMVTIVQVWYWCRPNVTIAVGERVGVQFKLLGSSDP
jgi:hypothetical protein